MSKGYISIFIGVFGAGKDTQAKLLEDKGLVRTFSVGQILRDASKDMPWLKEYLLAGTLVPTDKLAEILINFFNHLALQKVKHLIITGFPRVFSQIDVLKRLIKETGLKFYKAFNFVLEDAQIADRILHRYVCPKCGALYNLRTNPPKDDTRCDFDGAALVKRQDDNLKTLCRRYTVFVKQTIPVIEYFRKLGCLVDIDANRTIKEIQKDLEEYFTKEVIQSCDAFVVQ